MHACVLVNRIPMHASMLTERLPAMWRPHPFLPWRLRPHVRTCVGPVQQAGVGVVAVPQLPLTAPQGRERGQSPGAVRGGGGAVIRDGVLLHRQGRIAVSGQEGTGLQPRDHGTWGQCKEEVELLLLGGPAASSGPHSRIGAGRRRAEGGRARLKLRGGCMRVGAWEAVPGGGGEASN